MIGTDFNTTKALMETSKNSSLSQREKHLIGLAVTLTQGCDLCTNRRFKDAFTSGVTKKELSDLVDLVALTNAGVVVRTALRSIDKNSFEEICNDEVCKSH